MLQKTISALFSGFEHKPIPYEPVEVMDAFRKVDRILDAATESEHINTAERMFANMLNRFNFNEAERSSPLVIGMQARINKMRADWESMDRVVC
jgi:hypothetical protein